MIIIKSITSMRLLCLWAALSTNALAKDPANDDPGMIEKRVAFLQKNFAKFKQAKFQKAAGGDSTLQLLPSKDAMFDYEGAHFCGFKFTFPEWTDGDLEWMFLFAKTDRNKEFTSSTLSWYIIPEKGRCEGFTNFEQIKFSTRYPELKDRYPHTTTVILQSLDRARLTPGKTYGIWFRCEEADLPDIAFSMTIDSPRGAEEFGKLPLR